MSRYNPRLLRFDRQELLIRELATIEPEPEAVARVATKASARLIRLHAVPPHTAMLLKQELLALGADALLSPAVYLGQHTQPTDAILFASLRQLRELVSRLNRLPLPDLVLLAAEVQDLLDAESGPCDSLRVGPLTLSWGERTYIMGIINITPDSFSGDGLARSDDAVAAALEQGRRFLADGADLLDVGGESTRPGAQSVSVAEELARVVPVVQALASEHSAAISVDTYHAEVAAAALDAGAHMVNDVWGLRTPEGSWNEPLARLLAERGFPLVLMHNRRAPASRGALGGFYGEVAYGDLLGEIVGGLRSQVAYAESLGISRANMMIDPGIGFGKTPEQNLELLRRLGELRSLGLPLLVGASRKSFIGLALGLPPQERDEGTAATTVLAVQAGADIVRVHNVQLNARAARMADAVVRGRYKPIDDTR